jgi:hypothetical protein
MKNFKKLMMLASVIVSFSLIASEKSDEAYEQEAVSEELNSARLESAQLELLQVLAQQDPDAVEQIVVDEQDLEAAFSSIRKFVETLNRKLEKAIESNQIAQTEVARLTIETADAQAALDKATARQRAKHKNNHKFEQTIEDALMKAKKNIQILNKKASGAAKRVGKIVASNYGQVKHSRPGRMVAQATSNAIRNTNESINNSRNALTKEMGRLTLQNQNTLGNGMLALQAGEAMMDDTSSDDDVLVQYHENDYREDNFAA